MEIFHAALMDKRFQAVQEQFSDVIKHLDNTQMLVHQMLLQFTNFVRKKHLLNDVRISVAMFSGEKMSAEIAIR